MANNSATAERIVPPDLLWKSAELLPFSAAVRSHQGSLNHRLTLALRDVGAQAHITRDTRELSTLLGHSKIDVVFIDSLDALSSVTSLVRTSRSSAGATVVVLSKSVRDHVEGSDVVGWSEGTDAGSLH